MRVELFAKHFIVAWNTLEVEIYDIADSVTGCLQDRTRYKGMENL